MTTATICAKCTEFNSRFRCNAPDECDCPKCQGLCECPVEDWVMFTKRTDDPKLTWLERALDTLGIPHRRNGDSFHAPIMEVPSDRLDEAFSVLGLRVGRYTIDDIADDNRRWNQDIENGFTDRFQIRLKLAAITAKNVRAVNAHDDLYNSLAWIVEFCSEHPEWFGAEDGAEGEWLENARKVLKLAGV